MDMEMTKHLRATTIIALVGLEAKVDIGIYGVHTLLLKLIGSNLVHQADTPTLLLHINDDALAFLLDHLHGLVELLATVATHAAQDITGCTGRVDTHEDGLVVLPFSLDERHMLQTVAGLAERDQTEMTIGGWEINLLTDFYAGFFAETIGDKVLDRDDTKSPFLGLLLQLRHTGHGAVVVHDLHQRTGWIQTGQLTKIHCCFGMTGTTQHAVVLSIQRIDMTRTTESLRCGGGICKRKDGRGAVVCGYACRTTFQLIYRDRERCA